MVNLKIIHWNIISQEITLAINLFNVWAHPSGILPYCGSFWGKMNAWNLANLLAISESQIWLYLAKFEPCFGYFDFFDLATLSLTAPRVSIFNPIGIHIESLLTTCDCGLTWRWFPQSLANIRWREGLEKHSIALLIKLTLLIKIDIVYIQTEPCSIK